jgi:hypothetical protein
MHDTDVANVVDRLVTLSGQLNRDGYDACIYSIIIISTLIDYQHATQLLPMRA